VLDRFTRSIQELAAGRKLEEKVIARVQPVGGDQFIANQAALVGGEKCPGHRQQIMAEQIVGGQAEELFALDQVVAQQCLAHRIDHHRHRNVGQGLMVLTASDLAAEGETPERIRAEVEDLRSRTRVYGAVGTLDFLKRGGRIGGAAHLVGSLLSIQPVIEVRGGVVELESKQRTRTRVLQYLASKALNAGPLDRLAVANGAADDADVLVGQLAAAETRHDLILTELGPVVGAHAGPGTVGVCFQIRR